VHHDLDGICQGKNIEEDMTIQTYDIVTGENITFHGKYISLKIYYI
jgi:hypothetical protein